MRRMALGATGMLACVAVLSVAQAMSPMKSPRFEAMIKDASGAAKGTATGDEKRGVTTITVAVSGLASGIHGLHIHEVGKCEGPAFASAGAHWNPAMKQHGRMNPMGAHAGDLPNITVGADGKGTAQFTLASPMAPMMDADGATIVVHATADDYRTDPSGNAGGRIACGVIRLTR